MTTNPKPKRTNGKWNKHNVFFPFYSYKLDDEGEGDCRKWMNIMADITKIIFKMLIFTSKLWDYCYIC